MTQVLILAGGLGRRLGTPKAWLDWDGRPLLLRVLDRLAPLAHANILVAGRPGQALPRGAYDRVDDARLDEGPLAGLAVGLGRIARQSPEARVAVSACDYPFAEPALFAALAADSCASVVIPAWEGQIHPLQAVWRADVAEACERALTAGDRRVRTVIDRVGGAVLPADSLGGLEDPARALLNLNDPDDLLRARGLAP